MIVTTAQIPNIKLIDPVVFDDSRGYFFEAYNAQAFTEKLAVTPDFFQDNESLSKRGTIRGLHLQRPPFAQAKLVWVITGEILDIALSCRPNSPSFGQHICERMSTDSKRQLRIPIGFVHSFQVLSSHCILNYKVTAPYHKQSEMTVNCLDPKLAIAWRDNLDIMISDEEDSAPSLADFPADFWEGIE
jgi:dTDP-4-dehydrorhamnose 3,5-epimerase